MSHQGVGSVPVRELDSAPQLDFQEGVHLARRFARREIENRLPAAIRGGASASSQTSGHRQLRLASQQLRRRVESRLEIARRERELGQPEPPGLVVRFGGDQTFELGTPLDGWHLLDQGQALSARDAGEKGLALEDLDRDQALDVSLQGRARLGSEIELRQPLKPLLDL